MKICGAKTRSGTPCQKPGSGVGGRCRLHGGASPTGKDSRLYKHGGFSKYLQPGEEGRFAAFRIVCGLMQDEPSDEEELGLFRAVTAIANPNITPEQLTTLLKEVSEIRLRYQKLRGGEKAATLDVNLNATDELASRIAGLAARRRTASDPGDAD